MSDVRVWQGVEYKRSSPPLTVVRADELTVEVTTSMGTFKIGVNHLRPLAEAFSRVAAEIDTRVTV